MFRFFLYRIYKTITHKVNATYKVFRLLFNRVDKPVSFFYTFQRKDAKMALVYSASVAPTKDFDVVKRVLTVKVNGEVTRVSVYDATAVDLGELSFSQGDNVELALVDYDDADNTSEPAVLSFVATDTLPPQVPDGFVVALVREENPDVTPEVPEVPEVAPEVPEVPEVAPEVTPEVLPETTEENNL